MDCSVTLEAAVSVYDVETVEEAVSIAIAKTGQMLNPDLSYVDISKAEEADGEPGYVAADEGLVGLNLEMTVFGVETKEHAEKIAQQEIGQELDNVPLNVADVSEVDGDNSETSDEEVLEPESEEDELPDWDDVTEAEDGN